MLQRTEDVNLSIIIISLCDENVQLANVLLQTTVTLYNYNRSHATEWKLMAVCS